MKVTVSVGSVKVLNLSPESLVSRMWSTVGLSRTTRYSSSMALVKFEWATDVL